VSGELGDSFNEHSFVSLLFLEFGPQLVKLSLESLLNCKGFFFFFLAVRLARVDDVLHNSQLFFFKLKEFIKLISKLNVIKLRVAKIAHTQLFVSLLRQETLVLRTGATNGVATLLAAIVTVSNTE
jgi:hypothetical protein